MTKIQIRRGTTAEWTSANPILASAEMGMDTTLNGFKMGDGTSKWTDLPFKDAAAWLVNSATTAAEVIQRTNLAIDPRAINAANFGINAGGGNLTMSYVGGKRRWTWGTNATAHGGANVTTLLIPGNFQPGETYTVSLDAKFSRNNTLNIGFYFKNAAGSSVSGGSNNHNVMTAGVEKRLSVTGTVASAGTSLYVYVYTSASFSGTFGLAGDWLEIDRIDAEKGSTADPYIDGDLPQAGNLTYRWSGAQNASTSYQMSNANLMIRSASGTVQVGKPTQGADAANLEYIQSLGSYDVLTEGAKGDATDAGGTDDTLAFQKAMDKAQGSFGQGGTMLIPPRAYHIQGSVTIRSNVRILGYGAIIRKYGLSGGYSAFQALSNGTTGYGSSAVNVTFEGMTFRGKFTGLGVGGNGNCVTLHHAQNFTFRKVTWTENVLNGHCIDMMGCDGILVDDCRVFGFNSVPGDDKAYTEAFQVDYSISGGGGSDPLGSFDGLPSINITVQNSKFKPLTIGGVTYPAPNPMGSHQRIAGQWFDNIKFLNNYVEYGIDTASIVGGFSSLTRGWLHFFCVRNLEVCGNRFKSATGRASTVLKLYPISTGYQMADINNPDAVTSNMTPMSVTNLLVEDNIFEGFASDTTESIIDVRGTLANKFRNARFVNNTWIDCIKTPGIPQLLGQDTVYVQDGVGVEFVNTNMTSCRNLVYAYRVNKLRILGGILKDMAHQLGRFSECNDVTIDDVHAENFGGLWYSYNNEAADSSSSPQVRTAGFSITGGSIIQNYTAAQLAVFNGGAFSQPITLSGVSEFYIEKTRAPYSSVPGYTQLIYAYGNAADGWVEKVRAKGWVANVQTGTAIGLVKLGASTNVTSTNNTPL